LELKGLKECYKDFIFNWHMTILGLGLLYAFFRLFTGTGGGGLGDFFDALGYTSIFLFLTSFFILIFNIQHYKHHVDTFIFMLLGLPMTLMATEGIIKNINYSREPDLTVKYQRPVSYEKFKGDSAHIEVAIDSLIALRNRQTGGAKVQYAFIDTIIYSQTGDRVFISYIKKYEPNDLGNDFTPSYLYGDTRNPEYWDLEEVKYNLSGNFQDTASLKRAVRRFYFNQFSFLDKDSSKDNFFWRKIMHP
jgi:hypothetical protein